MQKLIAVTPSKNDQEHIPEVVWPVLQIVDKSAYIIHGQEDHYPMMFDLV